MSLPALLKIRIFLQHYGWKVDLPRNVSLQTLESSFKDDQNGLILYILHGILVGLSEKHYIGDNKSLHILALIKEATNWNIRFNTAPLAIQCLKELVGVYLGYNQSQLNVRFNKEKLLGLNQYFQKNSYDSKIYAVLFLIEILCRTPKFLSKEKVYNDKKTEKESKVTNQIEKFYGKDVLRFLGCYEHKKKEYKLVVFKEDSRAIYRFEAATRNVTILDSFEKVAEIVKTIKDTKDPLTQYMIISLRDVVKEGIVNFEELPQEDNIGRIKENLEGDCWKLLADAYSSYSKYADDYWGSEWNSSLDRPFAEVLRAEKNNENRVKLLILLWDNCQSITNYYEKNNMPKTNCYKKLYSVKEMKTRGFNSKKVSLKFLKNLDSLGYLLADIEGKPFLTSQTLVIDIICRILANNLNQYLESMSERLDRMRKHEEESKKAAKNYNLVINDEYNDNGMRESRKLNRLRRSTSLPDSNFDQFLNKKFKKQAILK